MNRQSSDHLGLYLHIPFCRQKCFYCDFPSQAGKESLFAAYTAALCREITMQGGRFGASAVDTVYIGGGTPTVLAEAELARIGAAVRRSFRLTDDCEWTVEANPGTVTAAKLNALREAGANRLSIGVQSFDDMLLPKIGRLHTASQAEDAVWLAQQAGFDNISLDLIYALPEQTMASLAASVNTALTLPIRHISIYGLIIEENTVFGRWAEQGRLQAASAELEEAMYDYMIDALTAAGFARYEIASFAKDGAVSRHNLKYWHDKPYLGLGAAASSYIGRARFANQQRAEEYIRCIEAGEQPTAEYEELSDKELMEEFCFLALRTTGGIDKAAFAAKFSQPLEAVFGSAVKRLKSQALLTEAAGHIALTRLGMKYGNQVFREFILE